MTKEDLKERLVVAEMVMKKLFERNKNLEDQMVAANATTKEMSFEIDDKRQSEFNKEKRHSHSIVGSPKNLGDIEANDISTLDKQAAADCPNCVDLRKEMISKEKEMQERFNDL